ncbi:MAG: hypothetical protein HYY48_11260, partial [Gammaproteobacteria bacterium]|nr:hypothetical protein [Gammaproteobacteria bacterium]
MKAASTRPILRSYAPEFRGRGEGHSHPYFPFATRHEAEKMKHLSLSPELRLPLDVAGEAVGLIANRGAGKSYTSAVVENLAGVSSRSFAHVQLCCALGLCRHVGKFADLALSIRKCRKSSK